jgi:hypothetical protein
MFSFFAIGLSECALCAAPCALPCTTDHTESADLLLCELDSRQPAAPPIMFCGGCGYARANLAHTPVDPLLCRQVIASKDYQTLLAHSVWPPAAIAFACAAMLHQAQQEILPAAFALQSAAWACDDYGLTAAAIYWRKQTLEQMRLAIYKGMALAESHGRTQLLIIDTARRAGNLPLAISLCRDTYQADPLIAACLRFELLLLAQKDCGPYTVAQALGNAAGAGPAAKKSWLGRLRVRKKRG